MSRVWSSNRQTSGSWYNRSHAMNVQLVVVFYRIYIPIVFGLKVKTVSLVTLRLTAKGMRIIDKKGIDAV